MAVAYLHFRQLTTINYVRRSRTILCRFAHIARKFPEDNCEDWLIRFGIRGEDEQFRPAILVDPSDHRDGDEHYVIARSGPLN
jgi:hypothetical protein